MTGILQSLLGSISSAAAVVTDAYFNLVTLLLPGNGTNGAQNNTFLDSGTANGGVGFTITRNPSTGPNAPTQGTFSPFSQTGWSNYFGGSQSINAAASADFQLTGDFTIEGWVYTTSTSDTSLVVQQSSSNYFALNVQGGTGLNIYLNSATATISPTDRVPALNTWNHVALVRSGTGSGNVKIYLNGVASSTTATNTSTLGYNALFYVGAIGTNSSGSFVGYISNVRVVNGTALYTNNFTPSTTPLSDVANTKLLTCQSNRFIDTNTQVTAKTITVNGTPSVQAFSPFAPTAAYSAATVGGSGYFDGSGDYLSNSSDTIIPSTGDFTAQFWIYPTQVSSLQYLIATTNNSGNKLHLYINSSAYVGVQTGSSYRDSSTTKVVANAWNHIACTRTGSTYALFVNGVSQSISGSGTMASTLDVTPTYIAARDAGTGAISGYLGSSKITTVVETISVPTAPYTSDGNTRLLTNFTNAGITDATAKNDLETIGTAQISTAQSKFGGSSIYIPGTATNYVKCATSANLFDIAGADFTIEFWVRFDSVAANRSFVSKYGNSTETAGDLGYNVEWLQATNQLRLVLGKGTGAGDALYTWSWTPSTGIWYHVAVTRSGTSGRAFVDGAQIGSTLTVITNDVASPNSVIIGKTHTVAQYMNGYMSDIRITKGFARYTGAFTAPTAAFPLQ